MTFLVDYNLDGYALVFLGILAKGGWLELISVRFVTFGEAGLLMKNSTHSWVGVFGHGEWGMGEAVRSWGLPKWSNCRHGKELPMPNAQCPKSAGGYPSPPTLGLEFPADFHER
ncbi:hypothetical protein LC574_25555 [Nostoc sp. CHAB 5715]|nr:hypothetical protein [Nostoc sp. CHAB 5715]